MTLPDVLFCALCIVGGGSAARSEGMEVEEWEGVLRALVQCLPAEKMRSMVNVRDGQGRTVLGVACAAGLGWMGDITGCGRGPGEGGY